LNLLAVFQGLKCFASHLRGCDVFLRVGNSSFSYINRMSPIRFFHLSAFTREIWCWCANRDLFVYASYVPHLCLKMWKVDAESRIISEKTERTLKQDYFNRINTAFNIDLFASSINIRCQYFVFWFPEPLAVDAFSLNWSTLYIYVLPPFILILRILRKVITGSLCSRSTNQFSSKSTNQFSSNRILICYRFLSGKLIQPRPEFF